jgi:hypothetical protein
MRDNVLLDLSDSAPTTQGLLRTQQILENSWDRISDFAYRVTQNPRTAALVIPSVGFLRNFRDVQSLMAQIIGSIKQVPFGFSPDRPEP